MPREIGDHPEFTSMIDIFGRMAHRPLPDLKWAGSSHLWFGNEGSEGRRWEALTFIGPGESIQHA